MSNQIFNKFVEVGRVCRVNYGPDEGKLCAISDVVTFNRVLVDGQSIDRQVIPIKRLTLTNLKVPIRHGARTGNVRKNIVKANVNENFAKTALGKKLAQVKRRSQLNDFERFKVMVLKKRLARILRNKKLCVQAKQENKKDAKKKK